MKQLIHFLTYLITTVLLLACSHTENERDFFLDMKSPLDASQIKILYVKEGQTNFDALRESRIIYYLEHMSPNYDSHGNDFWLETKYEKKSLFQIRKRKGACISDSLQKNLLCIENQKHIIDKEKNRVIQFVGNGSGYFVTVDFEYDKADNLIEYKAHGDVFFLEYSSDNSLKRVVKTEHFKSRRKRTQEIIFR